MRKLQLFPGAGGMVFVEYLMISPFSKKRGLTIKEKLHFYIK